MASLLSRHQGSPQGADAPDEDGRRRGQAGGRPASERGQAGARTGIPGQKNDAGRARGVRGADRRHRAWISHGHGSAARLEPDDRRGHRCLRPHGVLRRRGTGGRGRVAQFRCIEHPPRPPRARSEGQLLPARRAHAPQPDLDDPDPDDVRLDPAAQGHCGRSGLSPTRTTPRTTACSTRWRACMSTGT